MQKIKKEINVGFGAYIRGIAESLPVLGIMAIVTLIVTLVYIFLLRWITGPILYGSLLLIFLFLVGCTGYMFKVADGFEDKESDDYKFAFGIMIVFAVLTVLFLVCVCCMWKALALGVNVMKTASDFIGDNKRVLILPFLAYFFCVPIILWWTMTSIFIYGLGEPNFA